MTSRKSLLMTSTIFPRTMLFIAAALLLPCEIFGGIDIHDPHIIKHKDYYYIYSTGRRGKIIQTLRSKDLYAWEPVENVFSGVMDWVKKDIPNCRGFWAPDIHHFNGRYGLYYSASSFGSQRSIIGLATNVTLNPADPNYRWVDEGKVIESQEGMAYNAIDAGIVTDTEGRLWMSFGSFWDGIKMIELNPETGKPLSDKPEVLSLARRPVSPNAIEAPHIIYRKGYYYLFVSFDYCCRRADSTYKIMVGRSKEVVGPYADKDGIEMLKGGGTLLLESSERWKGPGHNSILSDNGKDYLVYHTYDADSRGMPVLQIRPLSWTEDGWPVAGELLEGLTLSEEQRAVPRLR